MCIDLTAGGRGNKGPNQEVQVINQTSVNDELKAETTAVVTFFLDSAFYTTIDDLWEQIDVYMADSRKYLKKHKTGKRMAADFRKIFWCVQVGKWKVINFYFNTPWAEAAVHGNNRKLLEPYMGKNYSCAGAIIGRLWSEEQSVLAGCIKLCDVSLEDGIKKYDENMTKIAKLIATQLH